MRIVIIIFCTILLYSCENSNEPKVTIAVANNMQYAMEDIATAFEKAHHIKVEISASSSGTLTTQIKQGAPFDIFISANMKYPNALFVDGLTVDAPEIYAYGSLILWTLNDVKTEGGLKTLLADDFRKIAIANPETAPYGIAAVEALKNANLYEDISPKLIWGEGIGQVNQYIKSKSVDAGLTSKSVLFSKKLSKKGNSIEIDKSLYKPIQQGLVMLKFGKEKNFKNADLFYKFMFSDETKTILTKFGYEVN